MTKLLNFVRFPLTIHSIYIISQFKSEQTKKPLIIVYKMLQMYPVINRLSLTQNTRLTFSFVSNFWFPFFLFSRVWTFSKISSIWLYLRNALYSSCSMALIHIYTFMIQVILSRMTLVLKKVRIIQALVMCKLYIFVYVLLSLPYFA